MEVQQVTDRRSFLLAIGAATAGCNRRAATGYSGYAFVANEQSRSIAAVNLATFRMAREIPLDGHPTAIIARGRRPEVYALTPENGTVHEIDADSFAVRRKARVAPSCISMRMAEDGLSIWALSLEARSIVQLPLDRFEPAMRIRLPGAPSDFDLAGDRAAISMPQEGSLAVAGLRQGKVEAVVGTGPEPGTVRFHNGGRRVLCGNRGNRTLTVYDVATGKIAAHLPVAVSPDNFCYKASNDGEMYITGPGMDALVVVYPYQTEVHETRLIGRSPGAMAVSAAPEFLFVANTESGQVTVMDVPSGQVRWTVTVGAEPRHIAITPDNQFALALNSRSGDMAVIYIGALTNTARARTAPTPLFTMIPVGARPVSAAIRQL